MSSPTAQGSEYLLGWNHITAVGFLKGFFQKPAGVSSNVSASPTTIVTTAPSGSPSVSGMIFP